MGGYARPRLQQFAIFPFKVGDHAAIVRSAPDAGGRPENLPFAANAGDGVVQLVAQRWF